MDVPEHPESSRKSSANSSYSSLKDSDYSATFHAHNGQHHTLEFMEMCANLIIALACWWNCADIFSPAKTLILDVQVAYYLTDE